MFDVERDSSGIKIVLGVINFCINIVTIRREATNSALNYLMSNMEKRKFDTSCKESLILIAKKNSIMKWTMGKKKIQC